MDRREYDGCEPPVWLEDWETLVQATFEYMLDETIRHTVVTIPPPGGTRDDCDDL